MTDSKAFDVFGTYVHLRDGGEAHEIPVDENFWPDLMVGRRRYDGRMITASQMTAAWDHWERHPAGEEVLYLLSGAADFILETEAGERRVALRKETPCFLVPAGVWHRCEVVEPGEVLFITVGEGTEHKPV